MLDLGFATRLGEENPEILDVFAGETELSAIDSSTLAAAYVNYINPLYDRDNSNPLQGFRANAGGGNCVSRAGLIHAILTENPRLYPVIVSADIARYDSGHYLNVVLDTDTGQTVVIDNGVEHKKGIDYGTFEILLEGWATKKSVPEIYGPIFDIAMAGILKLYDNPLEEIIRSTLKHVEIPFDDGGFTISKAMHLVPGEIPQSIMTDDELVIHADTLVTILNNDASNRFVDKVAYRGEPVRHAE